MAKKNKVLKENEDDAEDKQVCRSDFPPSFVFGVVTSAYQIEGGCKEGGRGASIWDAFTHTEGNILDRSNGDVAVDHYYRYKEDIDIIAKLGFEACRFSISWSHIFPDGLGTKVNEEGIAFYNNIIDTLLEKGMKPFELHVALELCLLSNYFSNTAEYDGGELIGEKVRLFLLNNACTKTSFIWSVQLDVIDGFESVKRFCTWQAASEWLYVVPWGIRKVLNYIAQQYNNPRIYVTENENEISPLHEMLDDKLRVKYFKQYLTAVSRAIKDGVDVRGYFAWSLLDNFECAQGYTKHFGLVYVDYKNGLARHPKASAYWFSRFLKGIEGKIGKEE